MTAEESNPVSETSWARSTVTGLGSSDTLPGCSTAPVIWIWKDSTVRFVDGVSWTTRLTVAVWAVVDVEPSVELVEPDELPDEPPHPATAAIASKLAVHRVIRCMMPSYLPRMLRKERLRRRDVHTLGVSIRFGMPV